MADFNVEIDMSEVENKLKKLKNIPNATTKVLKRVLTRVSSGMKTDASAEVEQNYTLKKKSDITKKISVEKAQQTALGLTAGIHSNARPARLTSFKTRKNRNPGKKGAATAFANPKRSSPGGRTGGFIATVSAGSNQTKGIFIREGSKRKATKGNYVGKMRQPIRQLYGPAVSDMLKSNNIKEKIQQKAKERFEKRLDAEINYILESSDK